MHGTYHDRIRRSIDRHGVFIQAVSASMAVAANWAYTIGNHARGAPELIVFGLPSEVAGHLLNLLTDRVRVATMRPAAGVVVPELLGPDDRFAIRLGAVAPRWARLYGRLAFGHYRVERPDGIRFLQVVVPDLAGRFRDDPGYDRATDQYQPDLSHPERPWREPLVNHDDLADLRGADTLVLLPIVALGEDEGRVEAVPGIRIRDRQVMLVRPPALADWITAGALVEVGDEEEALAAPLPAARPFVRVVEDSDCRHLTWVLYLGSQRDVERCVEAIWALEDLDIMMSVSTAAVHVAVEPQREAEVRRVMRDLVRDGVAWEHPAYHAPALSEVEHGPGGNEV